MTIYGYYHICAINNWEKIVNEQVRTIIDSGLVKECKAIYITLLSPTEINLAETIFLPAPFVVRFQSNDLGLYESKILNLMREDCIKMTPDESKNVHIWYIHSKGISTKHQNPRTHLKIRDWRRLMEYFVITNWRDCVKTLENGFDTAGINYHLSPSPHYSGNFWWSTADYIKKLPELPIPCNYKYPEFWITRANAKAHCFFESHVNHYISRYPLPDFATKKT